MYQDLLEATLILLTLSIAYKLFKNIYINKSKEDNKYMIVYDLHIILTIIILLAFSILDFLYMFGFMPGNNSVIVKYLLILHSISFAILLIFKKEQHERNNYKGS